MFTVIPSSNRLIYWILCTKHYDELVMVPAHEKYTFWWGMNHYVKKYSLLICTESGIRSNDSIEERTLSLSLRRNNKGFKESLCLSWMTMKSWSNLGRRERRGIFQKEESAHSKTWKHFNTFNDDSGHFWLDYFWRPSF